MLLGNGVTDLLGNLDGNLCRDLMTFLARNLDTLLIGHLSCGGDTLFSGNLSAPWNRNSPWDLDWNLGASLFVNSRALGLIRIQNLNTLLSRNVLAALFVSSFVSCLLFINALLLVDCATLLIRNSAINLMTFLFVNCVADLVVLGLVLGRVDGFALLDVRRLAHLRVDGLVDVAASRLTRPEKFALYRT